MSDKLKEMVFFTELDAILDTRLSILAGVDREEALKELSDNYLKRAIDSFGMIGFSSFRELYAKRDKSVLRDAIATRIFIVISSYLKNLITNVLNSPFHYEPVLVVNVYPYELTDDELIIIRDMIYNKIDDKCEVRLVNMPLSEVTPSYINVNDIAYLCIYDYAAYLNYHFMNDSFKYERCVDTAIITPRIIFSKPEAQLQDLEPLFQLVEDLYGPFIGINFIPVRDFSINIDLSKAKQNIE